MHIMHATFECISPCIHVRELHRASNLKQEASCLGSAIDASRCIHSLHAVYIRCMHLVYSFAVSIISMCLHTYMARHALR